MLLEIGMTGILERVISFTLGSNDYDMLSFPQNLVLANNYYYMGGAMNGYITRYQSSDSFGLMSTDQNLDIFLFPLGFYNRPTEGCINERLIR